MSHLHRGDSGRAARHWTVLVRRRKQFNLDLISLLFVQMDIGRTLYKTCLSTIRSPGLLSLFASQQCEAKLDRLGEMTLPTAAKIYSAFTRFHAPL
jgi:hypothetical protein